MGPLSRETVCPRGTVGLSPRPCDAQKLGPVSCGRAFVRRGAVVMRTAGPGWIAAVRALGVRAVAERLGLLPAPEETLKPCPACGAERRGTHDGRGPVGVRSDDAGWRCHACDARGDAPALAAALYKLRAGPELRERLVAVGLLDPPHGSGRPRAALPPLPRPRVLPPLAPPPRLDPHEVAALWDPARPVWTATVSDPRAWPWLRARGLDWAGWRDEEAAAALALAEEAGEPLARVATVPRSMPEWARIGLVDWASGYPLLLPCYDAAGRMVALRGRRTAWREVDGRPCELRARAVWSWGLRGGPHDPLPLPYGWHEIEGEAAAKEAAPRRRPGVLRGTVYACPVGRAVLRGEVEPGGAVRGAGPVPVLGASNYAAVYEAAPPMAPPPTVEPVRWSGLVLVVEGGADYLRRAVEFAGYPLRPAVFGVWSGAWPDNADGDKLAAALDRAGATVELRLDADEAGAGFARSIRACLARAGVPITEESDQ